MDGGIPDGAGSPPDGTDGDGDGDATERFRGWVPPDDRLWRHPSEGGAGTSGVPAVAARPAPRPWFVGTAAAVVVVTLAAGGVVMAMSGAGLDASSTRPSPTSTTLRSVTGGPVTTLSVPVTAPGRSSTPSQPGPTGRSTTPPALASAAASLAPSIVALTATTAGHASDGNGVAVETGGIVVAPAAVVAGATAITAVTFDGRRTGARVVAVDGGSGLAVLQIGADPAVAPFDSDTGLAGGATAALVDGTGAAGAAHVTALDGTVASTGATVVSGPPAGLTATVVDAAGDDVPGCVLVDGMGQVAGMLAGWSTAGADDSMYFLPAYLILGVVRQLVATGSVVHGWLGIQSGTDAAAPAQTSVTTQATIADDPTTTLSGTTTTGGTTFPVAGALVGAVAEGSAADTAGLAPGDVVIAVDGDPVVSVADLRTHLYADAPGTSVELTVERGSATLTATAVLTAAPDANQPSSSSP